MKCPNCFQDIASGKFCKFCGTPLNAPTTSAGITLAEPTPTETPAPIESATQSEATAQAQSPAPAPIKKSRFLGSLSSAGTAPSEDKSPDELSAAFTPSAPAEVPSASTESPSSTLVLTREIPFTAPAENSDGKPAEEDMAKSKKLLKEDTSLQSQSASERKTVSKKLLITLYVSIAIVIIMVGSLLGYLCAKGKIPLFSKEDFHWNKPSVTILDATTTE